MLKFALRYIAGALAFPLADFLLPGIACASWQVAFFAGACLMLFYLLLRPIAKVIFGIFNFFTLGLVGTVIDAGLIYLVARYFPGAIYIQNALWAVAAAAIVNLVRGIAGKMGERK